MISIGGIFNLLSTSKGSSMFPSGGGEVTTVDGDTVISFSADSTLVVYQTTTIQYFVVGGGGSGVVEMKDFGDGMSGGGAGQVLSGYTTLSPGTYTITVGAGGQSKQSGTSSSIGSSVIATGGLAPAGVGLTGGASGNGFSGSLGTDYDNITYAPYTYGYGGSGAGSTQNGTPGTLPDGGFGGSGTTTNIRGYSEQFAGGGGAANIDTRPAAQLTAGIGVFGGGNGYLQDSDTTTNATNGRANSGGGGGASKTSSFGKGGSGIVIIRFS